MPSFSPNVYRTPSEALAAFRWFDETGDWANHFATWERYLVIYVGAAAMWLIGKRLKVNFYSHGFKFGCMGVGNVKGYFLLSMKFVTWDRVRNLSPGVMYQCQVPRRGHYTYYLVYYTFYT